MPLEHKILVNIIIYRVFQEKLSKNVCAYINFYDASLERSAYYRFFFHGDLTKQRDFSARQKWEGQNRTSFSRRYRGRRKSPRKIYLSHYHSPDLSRNPPRQLGVFIFFMIYHNTASSTMLICNAVFTTTTSKCQLAEIPPGLKAIYFYVSVVIDRG